MGNSPKETLIIWIDEKVDDKSKHQNKLKEYENIKLKIYDEINDGFKFLKDIKFQKTIIILSKDFYPDFLKEIKKYLDDLFILPKIIIFTENAKEYLEENKDNKSLFLNDPFYNIGGVVDNINDLKKFVKSSINKFNPEFIENKDERIKNEELNYQLIKHKNELILPIYYVNYLVDAKEEEIKTFNQKIFKENKDVTPIEFLFSQLSEVGNIPLNIITKFLLRAYSTHLSFIQKMNEELLKGNYNEYLPIIQLFYRAADKCILDPENSKLYKGIFVERSKWEALLNNINENNELPQAILYGSSFFSFYKKENLVESFKEKYENIQGEDKIFLFLILEPTRNYMFVKNNTIIKKELSYFDDDYEILFFPFSCFEIKTIEKKNNKEYKIILNYLDKYTDLFCHEETRSFKDVPENEFSKLIFNSNIIIKSIEKPNWFNDLSKIGEFNKLSKTNLTLNNIPSNVLQNFQNQNSPIFNMNNSSNQIENSNQDIKYQNVLNNNINNYYQNYNNIYHQYPSNHNINYYNKQNQPKKINNNNNQQIFRFVKGNYNIFLTELVKEECINAINQDIYTNFGELEKIIRNKLYESTQENWSVTIINNNNYNILGSLGSNSLSIFQYSDSSINFYIIIDKIIQ